MVKHKRMIKIKTVTILGANGAMGSHCAGIIAGFANVKIFMIARDLTKARQGIETAKDSIKSDVIDKLFIPKTYKDLEECVSQSDWIFELATEDINLKSKLNNLISKFRKPNSIVSSVTSGLSITKLSDSFDLSGRKHYFGTHFYNPPYKMILCELISNPKSDIKIKKRLSNYLTNTLRRVVVETKDTPGFLGNRIGFQFLNEAALFAHKYESKGGFAYIDELLGGIIGHTMPPMATIDLVGLDIHQAIIDNIFENTKDEAHNTFAMPQFFKHLISKNYLGNKTNSGIYKTENGQKMVFNPKKLIYEPIPQFDFEFIKKIRNYISEGLYSDAFKFIIESPGTEANIIRYFIARYISYSLSFVGSIVKTKEDVDLVMGYGFNWLPPCSLVDLIGGKEITTNLIRQFNFIVPKIIIDQPKNTPFYTLQNQLDYRNFIRSN